MNRQTHTIKKQVLELQLSHEGKASLIQTEMGKLFYSQVIPIFEKHFARISKPGSPLRINRLELDLGRLDASNLAAELPLRIETALQAKLQAYVLPEHRSQTAQQDSDTVSDVESGPSQPKPAPQTEARSEESSGSPLEWLVYFLMTGNRPWWVGKNQHYEPNNLLARLIAEQPEATRTAIQKLAGDNQVIKRLAYQFFPETLAKLAGLLLKQPSQVLYDLIGELVLLANSLISSNTAIETIVWQVTLEYALTGHQAHTDWQTQLTDRIILRLARHSGMAPSEYLNKAGLELQALTAKGTAFTRQLPAILHTGLNRLSGLTSQAGMEEKLGASFYNLFTESVAVIKDLLKPDPRLLAAFSEIESLVSALGQSLSRSRLLSISTAILEPLHRVVNSTGIVSDSDPIAECKAIVRHLTSLLDRSPETIDLALVSQTHEAIESRARKANIASFTTENSLAGSGTIHDAPESESGREDPIDFNQSDEIYLSNGGLVLVWPFLQRFFQELGLVRNNAFASPELQQRGVYLLQFLVNKEPDCSEADLPLNKLLCGIDPSEPVRRNVELTELEIVECQNLLQAVIVHWGALGKTSIDGLRRAFLQREAILRIQNFNWLLQVEKQGHDVLLNRLPWKLTTIFLPWMKQVVHVDW